MTPRDEKNNPNYSLFGYEIYDPTRFAISTGFSVLFAFLLVQCPTQRPVNFKTKCIFGFMFFASCMGLFLSAENEAVQTARAGYRVFNSFRNTHDQNDVGQAPNLDFRSHHLHGN